MRLDTHSRYGLVFKHRDIKDVVDVQCSCKTDFTIAKWPRIAAHPSSPFSTIPPSFRSSIPLEPIASHRMDSLEQAWVGVSPAVST